MDKKFLELLRELIRTEALALASDRISHGRFGNTLHDEADKIFNELVSLVEEKSKK